MFLSDISIKRPVMMTMFLVVFLIFGAIFYFQLPLELTPNISFCVVTIRTPYAGAGPQEVESQVTKPIEDAVATVSQIDYMQSYSMDSYSLVTIMFEMTKEPNQAVIEVKDKVDGIVNDLPDNADIPIIEKFDMNAKAVMNIIFSGPLDAVNLYEYADKKLKDRFSQIEGVARVDLVGGQEREIQVELDNRRVFEDRISLAALAQILAAQNLDLPGGRFQKEDQEYNVRFSGKLDSVDRLSQLEVPTVYGPKPLGTLARVRDGGAEIRERATFFNAEDKVYNESLVLLSLIKSSDGNAVDLSRGVYRELEGIRKELPRGCSLDVVKDSAIFIEGSVEDTLGNIIIGIILTALVLLFFLHDFRLMLISALTIPFSIIATFLLLKSAGFTLNLMTLMGFSTSVGVLVTNSVVILENIFRFRSMGYGSKEAASKGTAEIVVAILASTMTNIMVFLPIANMSSIVGKMFKQFALTVTFATIFSLLVSFTLTPMLASFIPTAIGDRKKHPIGQKLERWFDRWAERYGKIVSWMVRNRKRSLAVIGTSALIFIVSLFSAARMGFEFMPMLDEGDINIEVELPPGMNLEQTLVRCGEIEKDLRTYPQVRHILVQGGKISTTSQGVNLALIAVKLIPAELRRESSAEMVDLFIRKFSSVPGVKLRISAVSSIGSGEAAPIQFYLKGPDESELERLKEEMVVSLKDVPGLVNFKNSAETGQPQVVIRPRRRKLTESGLTSYELALAVRGAVEGIEASQYEENGEKYDIRLLLSGDSADTPEKIAALNVVNSSNYQVYRLGDLADIEIEPSLGKIMHKDKVKAIEFTGNPAVGNPLGDVSNRIDERLKTLDLPNGYSIEWSGQVDLMKEVIVDMSFTFALACILTYMLLAAILESLTQPLMIMGTVPLALIGVFWALDLTATTMNIISMLSIVMLVGIVVNNAILILDYTNQLRREGKSISAALIEACPARLKPILMSTIAIMLGMLPMALGVGTTGREFRQPMGVVSIGGMIVSGLLTLLAIPSVYNLFSSRKKEEITHE